MTVVCAIVGLGDIFSQLIWWVYFFGSLRNTKVFRTRIHIGKHKLLELIAIWSWCAVNTFK